MYLDLETEFDGETKNTKNARILKKIAKEMGKKAMDTTWKSKPLHDQYPHRSQKADVDFHDTHQWLRSAGLIVKASSQETFRLIFFINGADPRCRFCNTSLKTIDHLISGYFIIALNEYTNRHNQAGQYIHWKIRNHYNTETHNKWYDHERLPVVNTPKVTFSGNSQLELTEKYKLTGQIQ